MSSRIPTPPNPNYYLALSSGEVKGSLDIVLATLPYLCLVKGTPFIPFTGFKVNAGQAALFY